MTKHFDELVGRAAARWIAAVDRRPVRVLSVVMIVTALALAYAARNLGVDADPDSMISRDLPFRQMARDFKQAFSSPDDAVLIVIDGESASVADRAADALAGKLRARPELFPKVHVPFGGPFFHKNGLLYQDLPTLQRMSDSLAAVQPLVAKIEQDPSLVGVSDLLGQALVLKAGGTPMEFELSEALDRVRGAADAARAGKRSPDPWGDALIGGSLSEDGKHRVVWVEPQRNFGELLYTEPVIAAIQEAVRTLELDPAHGVRVRLTGSDVLNYEELEAVQFQGKFVALLSLALFTIAVFFALRSVRMVFALVASLIVSLAWTNAFATVAIGHLNQVSAVFNVLIVGLGGEFGIHVCMRYAELLGKGRRRAEALVEMGDSIGSSLFSSAITTAIGFLVFMPTDYRGVAELGVISGGGMLLSLLSSLTVLPALLSLGAPPLPKAPPPTPPWAARLRHLPLRYARGIRWGAAGVGLASIVLVPRIGFDHNPINLRDPNTESVQAINDLLARSGTSPWTVDVIAPDIATADAEAERIRALPSVARALTISDYVPDDQAAKLEVLQTTALFLPPPAPPGPPRTPEEERAALARLDAGLARAAEGTSDPKLAESAKALAASLQPFVAGEGDLALLRRNVVGWLPEQIADLRAGLDASPVTAADLPDDLRASMLAADGRARIDVSARADLSNSRALEQFVDDVRSVTPSITGSAVSTLEWGRITSGAMKQALALGVGCMLLFLFFLWRNVWDTMLAFFPLALAAGVTCAWMVLAGMQFNFANVIVLPMLIGMGVDNGVHLVHRHRTEPDEEDVLGTSTARAVLFSTITTVLSFGSLAFASHRGMAAIGEILTLGVVATFVCYVVVLPAVLEWDDRRRRRREKSISTDAAA
ncbi:MAG TPA: MMPL family transporter [Myxococcota bacterium]|nr:MMPL family transporter [Myxococcota bacterium]